MEVPVRDWLIGFAIVVGLLIVSWSILLILARRLPPGILIPEFIPVIGPLDDIVVVALAPREVLMAAWPGELRLIERLLGLPSRNDNSAGSTEQPPTPADRRS
jgi:uncharacterized membrane protein YkvA (DUF1232 family)